VEYKEKQESLKKQVQKQEKRKKLQRRRIRRRDLPPLDAAEVSKQQLSMRTKRIIQPLKTVHAPRQKRHSQPNIPAPTREHARYDPSKQYDYVNHSYQKVSYAPEPTLITTYKTINENMISSDGSIMSVPKRIPMTVGEQLANERKQNQILYSKLKKKDRNVEKKALKHEWRKLREQMKKTNADLDKKRRELEQMKTTLGK